jgi:3-oxoacyl-[acyl-carrier protein] reductase
MVNGNKEDILELKDRVAIVTGGASGIGLETVKKFVRAGAKGVVAADISSVQNTELLGSLDKDHREKIQFMQTDVSQEDQVKRMVTDTVAAWGRVDILVNNASVCPVVRWEETNLESWNEVLSVNLTGMYLCSKEVIPHMVSEKWGRIIMVSSSAAYQGSYIAHPAYGVSKAGVIALMKNIAKTFSSKGILANAVVPGPVDTAMSARFTPEQRESFIQSTLLKRYGQAEEIAAVILFLSSPRSGYMTGSTVHVNGGQLLI